MQNGKNDSERHAEIRRRAESRAEATVYSLYNPYLDRSEKLEVEMWYQLPGHCVLYTFLALAVSSVRLALPWWYFVVMPTSVGLVAALLCWYAYSRALFFGLHLTVFHNLVQWLVTIGVALYVALGGSYLLAVIVVIGKLGLLLVLEVPYMVLYTVLAQPFHMHPKYAFFKRQYGHTFPFEE